MAFTINGNATSGGEACSCFLLHLPSVERPYAQFTPVNVRCALFQESVCTNCRHHSIQGPERHLLSHFPGLTNARYSPFTCFQSLLRCGKCRERGGHLAFLQILRLLTAAVCSFTDPAQFAHLKRLPCVFCLLLLLCVAHVLLPPRTLHRQMCKNNIRSPQHAC
jgi:hypothetical protein